MKKAICILLFLTASVHAEPIRCVGHHGIVDTVAFSSDGKTIVSGGIDRMVRIWDATTGKQVHELPIYDADDKTPIVSSVAVSPDGKMLAVAAAGSQPVTLWDLNGYSKRQNQLELNKTRPSAMSVRFSPNGKLALAGLGGIYIWDLDTNKTIFQIPGDAAPLVAFSPDSSLMITDFGDVYKLDTNEKIFSDHAASSYDVLFLPSGKKFVSVGCLRENADALCGGFLIWDLKTKSKIAEQTASGTRMFRCAAISPDGKTLATGGVPSEIYLWDMETRQPKGRLEGHTDQIYSLSFSPDGKKLASGSSDKSVLIWNLETDVKGGRP